MAKKQVTNEKETMRRLVVELRILEGTAEALQSRANLLNAALAELRVANMTLEGLEKEKNNAPLFVPIGSGSYIKAKLESAEKILVGVGADVAVERTLEEAKASLGNRMAELEKTRASLEQQFAEVVKKIQDSRIRLEELTARQREGEKAAGVRKTQERS